jgi:hypothetical protein
MKLIKSSKNIFILTLFFFKTIFNRVFNSSYLLAPFAICHDTPNLIILTQYLYGNQTLFHMLHKTSNSIEKKII